MKKSDKSVMLVVGLVTTWVIAMGFSLWVTVMAVEAMWKVHSAINDCEELMGTQCVLMAKPRHKED